MVSRQSPADGGAGADGDSSLPSVSTDGRYVAFNSSASNLSDADTENTHDIFVRDMETGAMTLATQGELDAADGGDSIDPFLSRDGTYVSFQSHRDDLSVEDNDDFIDVFRVQLLP